MSVEKICNGVFKRPCCHESVPVTATVTMNMRKKIAVCSCCHEAMLDYIRSDKAAEYGVSTEQIEMQWWQQGGYEDILWRLKGSQKWQGIWTNKLIRWVNKSADNAISFG